MIDKELADVRVAHPEYFLRQNDPAFILNNDDTIEYRCKKCNGHCGGEGGGTTKCYYESRR